MRNCQVLELGRTGWAKALELQQRLVAERKQGLVPDQLLFVEHPHTITVGRNGHLENLLAGEDVIARTGIQLYHTDRGGDVTYHGPGQLVGYPILDLREWKRDVEQYVRAIEAAIIGALGDFGIAAGREAGMTGVWVDGRKIAAIGVHLSRWVTSHGFALNVNTDLNYFRYIVPCGLHQPVTSMAECGVHTTLEEVSRSVAVHFGRVFDREVLIPALATIESEN
jgi:lipoyl(octanoyl) transferase